MRKQILEVSPSLTASTKTEMMLMQVQEEDGSVKKLFY